MLTETLAERSFDTGSVIINYAEGPPSGPALVVLHGGSARWQYNRPLVRALAGRWHVYAPDLRGHGRSGRVPGRYRLQDYADDIAAFLRRVVGEPAMLYGHSLGGEVALMVAGQHPALTRALIVGDAPLSPRSSPTIDDQGHRATLVLWRELAASSRPVGEIAAALRDMPLLSHIRDQFVGPGTGAPRRAGDVLGEEDEWFPFMAESLHQLDPDMLTAVLDDPALFFAGYDAETLLPTIACPVLLLQADPASGGIMRDEDVARALSLLPRGVHVRLTGVGHALPEEVVLRATTSFLDSL